MLLQLYSNKVLKDSEKNDFSVEDQMERCVLINEQRLMENLCEEPWMDSGRMLGVQDAVQSICDIYSLVESWVKRPEKGVF